jgi:hypothetical protein
LRLDDVAGRYMVEVGQHHVAADNTWREIGRWIERLGKDKLITEITGDDVAKVIAWRPGAARQWKVDSAGHGQQHDRTSQKVVH